MSREQALALRLGGATYRQIGEALSVSRQRAQQLVSPPASVRKTVVERASGKCQSCGVGIGQSGHVHHKGANGVDDYNDLSNLILLCIGCHKAAHPHIGERVLSAMGRNEYERRTLALKPNDAHELEAVLKRLGLSLAAWVRLKVKEDQT